MSLDIVRQVRAQYPTPVEPRQCVFICNEVAHKKNGNVGNPADGAWGLYPAPPGASNQWSGMRLDKICNRFTREVVDILGAASVGLATPQWGPEPDAPYVWTPVRPEWLPDTPPEPPPPPPQPGDLEARVAALEARVTQLDARFREAGEVMVRV